MRTIHVRREIHTADDYFDDWIVADMHLGSAASEEDRIKRNIQAIASNPRARVLLGGDILEAITKNDRRFQSDELAEWIPRRDIDWILDAQVDYAYEMLKPIKGQIIGGILGNHEHTSIRSGTNVHRRLCSALAIREWPYSVFVKIQYNRGTVRRSQDIYLHHGFGGGRTIGAKINRLHAFGDFIDANIYIMCHVHSKCWAEQKPKLEPHPTQEKTRERIRRYALAGTYLRTYSEGASGYGERLAYPPTSLGSIYWRTYPDKGIKHTMIIEQHLDEDAWHSDYGG